MRWLARNWFLLLWAAAIWIFSTHWFTGGNTLRFFSTTLHFFFPHASAAFLDAFNFAIRKCAHVSEYFVLSLLVLHAIRNGRPGWKLKWALLTLAIVFVYAGSDELHQVFVPGRGPAFTDVLLDTFGGALAQIAGWIWIRARIARKKRKEIAAAA